MGADEVGEGRGGLGNDTGDLDLLSGRGGGLRNLVKALDLTAQDGDLDAEVDGLHLCGVIIKRGGTRGEAVYPGVAVAGLGAAATFGRRWRGKRKLHGEDHPFVTLEGWKKKDLAGKVTAPSRKLL